MNIHGIAIEPWTAEDYEILRRFDKAGTGEIAMDMIQQDRAHYGQDVNAMLDRLGRLLTVRRLVHEMRAIEDAQWSPCVVIRIRESFPPILFRGFRNPLTNQFRETHAAAPTTFVAFYDVTTLAQARDVVTNADLNFFQPVLALARERVRELIK